MSNFEKIINALLKKENIEKNELIDYILEAVQNNEQNQQELIRLLPVIIENTNEQNISWMDYIKDLSTIDNFLDIYIDNMFLFNYRKHHFQFFKIMKTLQSIPIKKEQVNVLLNNMLNNSTKAYWEDIYYMIKKLYPEMIPNILSSMFKNKDNCKEALSLIQKDDNTYISEIYNNIDVILESTNHDEIFSLRDIVKNDKRAYSMVINKIKENTKDNIKKLIKSNYLKIIALHKEYHNLSYIYSEKFDNILEVIYLIIEDVCHNENIDITEIERVGSGSFSSVLLAKDKVIKIGIPGKTKSFPNNPYINAMLLRKEFPINNEASIFVEVSERVDIKSAIDIEELYQLYKKMRNIGLVWLDAANRNAGRLLKDNKASWRFDLPITDKSLSLDEFRGEDQLKKGDIVILDNDLIYDINDPNIPAEFATTYQVIFERRYQKDPQKSPIYGKELVLKKERKNKLLTK